MPNRQRSFFDQGHKPTTHRPWQRSKTTGDVPRQPEPPAKMAMTAPPIAASSQTRSKLKAFRFVEDAQEPRTSKQASTFTHEVDKENIPANEDGHFDPESLLPAHSVLPNPAPDCPQTPATRLPMAELIGNEDNVWRQPVDEELSPEERVCWRHSRSPNSSYPGSYLLTPAPRGQKRARSSSPPSSSAQELSKHFSKGKEDTMELQDLQKLLKTPQADPALELWTRYSANADNKSTPNAVPMLAFAHLLHGSSPQSSANGISPNSGGGLRRSLSCGTEWPTSKAKRRRIAGPDMSQTGDDVFGNGKGPQQTQGKSRLSRVNLLVDKLQESLANPTVVDRHAGPSSSSPLPERKIRLKAPSASPLQRLGETVEDQGSDSVDAEVEGHRNDEDHEVADRAVQVLAANQLASDSSNFDDDELDADMLEAAELAVSNAVANTHVNMDPVPPQLNIPPSSPDLLQPSAEYVTAENCIVSKICTEAATEVVESNSARLEDVDEFGDENDELFAAGLEGIASKYDDGSSGNCATAAPTQVTEHVPLLQDYTTVADRPQTIIAQDLANASNGRSDASSDDEFGDDIDIAQFAAVADAASTQAFNSASGQTSGRKIRAIKRYLIKQVKEGVYETDRGQLRPEKVLQVEDEKSKQSKAITLRQSWFDSPCTSESFIHLIGEFDVGGQCVVDDAHNMLILHPDHLVSSLVVADSFGCTRRAVLQDRIKATSEASAPMLFGTALHEIFQEAMKANRWDTVWLREVIETVVSKHIENIYEIKSTVPAVIDHLTSKMPELQAWAELFVRARPNSGAIIKDRNGQRATMCVNKLLDVEEHVWSPMYGLKGNIDATVQVVMDDGDGIEKTLTVPLEIKTGNNTKSASHRAQTALYTLLLSDRYDVEIAYGILYYMETSEISRIPAIRHEIRHMVMQRNELARYVRDRLQLPSMLKNSHLCGRCYAKVPCFIYHKLVDGGSGETSGLHEKFDEVVRHLKPEHAEFFRKWDDLLTKEEKEMLKFRRELWTMLSEEREKVGRCFGNVLIEPGSFKDEDGSKINRYKYTLIKQDLRSGFSFAESQLITGEPIVISDENGHFALANGYITQVQKRRIFVAVDRRLHNARVKRPGFDSKSNQVFAGIMEVMEDGGSRSTMAGEESQVPVLYRLDKDEFSNGMATVRNNLIQIMAEGTIGLRETRKLVVEGVAPTFQDTSTAYSLSDHADLNIDQKQAIEKVMSARDYAVVLGMPGTGKTTTIAHIIRALVSQGKSVLLTSYTHTAVDNILLKIQQAGISILRIGAVAKVHPEVKSFAILAGEPKKTVEELHDAYACQVVATTCLGINHPIFNERVFDYCIVDEASQITLPVCLGPIRMAKTFILVGDHYQLPPLVQNAEARENGLDISLFKLLSDKHPSSVVNLEHQYRMCADIMTLSNELIYDGRLKCGNSTVANRALTVPDISALKKHHHTAESIFSLGSTQQTICLGGPSRGVCWLRDMLEPSTKACFINTDPLLPASREDAKGSRIVNSTEAHLCTQLVTALLTTGVPASDVGVITLYRSQLALLKNTLRQQLPHASDSIEMHTADKFQGRDKEVVILSLVRSNEQKNVGDLLRDWRRVNVAFTRARTKLFVLGSRETMLGDGLLRKFVLLMERRGWIHHLSRGAVEAHLWEGVGGGGTQVGSLAAFGGGRKKSFSSFSSSPVKKDKGRGGPEKVARGLDVGRMVEKRAVLRDIVNGAC